MKKNINLKIIALFTLCFLMLSASLLYAESNAKSVFKVLASKGDVKISKSGSDSWEKLKSKQEIFERDRLKVERNAYLGLVHISGRTVEIKEAGTYNAADLVKSVIKKESSLSKRLSQYVFDEISQAEDILSSDDYHKSMSITGSVERSVDVDNPSASELAGSKGIEGLSFYNNVLIVNFPKKTNIITPVINFNWEPINGVTNFIVTIRDRFDREIMNNPVKNNSVDIDLNKLKLERDNYYIINVCIEDNPSIKSGDFAFQLLSEKKINTIRNEAAMLKQELNTESSLADRIILASFYEEKALFIEASKAYEQAMLYGTDIEEYHNMYKAFLYKIKTGNY